MTNHKKPTAEELDAQIKATQEELDKLDDPKPQDEPSKEEVPSEEIPQEEDSKEVIPAKTNEGDVDGDTDGEQKPTEDYRKKFTESTREAQVLRAKNKKLQEAIQNAGSLPEPTEQELQAEFPEWEEMTATERRLAKDSILNRRRFDAINSAALEGKNIDEWNQKVDEFVDDPKTLIANPELEGKQEEFKRFSAKPTRRGLDFDDLVLAFLGDVQKNRPAPKKGSMFPSGSAGPNDTMKPKDNRLSIEEASVLMQTDYKKYKEYLMAGKIKME
jgi:hypothetical protein